MFVKQYNFILKTQLLPSLWVLKINFFKAEFCLKCFICTNLWDFSLEEFISFKNVKLLSSGVRTWRDPKDHYFIDVDAIAQRVYLPKVTQPVRCRMVNSM